MHRLKEHLCLSTLYGRHVIGWSLRDTFAMVYMPHYYDVTSSSFRIPALFIMTASIFKGTEAEVWGIWSLFLFADHVLALLLLLYALSLCQIDYDHAQIEI